LNKNLQLLEKDVLNKQESIKINENKLNGENKNKIQNKVVQINPYEWSPIENVFILLIIINIHLAFIC